MPVTTAKAKPKKFHFGETSRQLAPGLADLLGKSIGFRQEMQPYYQGLVRKGVMQMGSDMNPAMIAKQNAMLMDTFRQNAEQARASMTGLGSGAQQGLALGAMNAANAGTADYANQLYDPQNQLQMLLQQIGLADQGSQIDQSALDAFNQWWNTQAGISAQKAQQSSGLGQALGGLAGMAMPWAAGQLFPTG